MTTIQYGQERREREKSDQQGSKSVLEREPYQPKMHRVYFYKRDQNFSIYFNFDRILI